MTTGGPPTSNGARQIGDDLHRLPPAAFTAARDAAVAQAKQAGDRDAAATLARLRRPSMAAWLVNLVALARPQLIDELIDLGEAIRRAQGSVPAAALRDLTAHRRRLLDQARREASTLAAAHQAPAPTAAHLAEAESTLAAAMADAGTARLVRSGRVTKAVTYSGFGQLGGVGSAEPVTGTRASTAGAAEARATRGAEAKAQDRLARATAALASAEHAERHARERVERLGAQLTELRGLLDSAKRDAHAAALARLGAEREHAAAQHRLSQDRIDHEPTAAAKRRS